MEELIKVKDLYNICDRIKEIDSRYELYFNSKSKRFEVWFCGDTKSLAIVVPQNIIDARIIEKLQKTRICRIDMILDEIETNNIMIENDIINNAVHKIMENINL